MPKLGNSANPAEQIVDILAKGKRPDDLVKLAKSLLNHALSHKWVDDEVRARIVISICWEYGLEPPDEIKAVVM